MLANLENWAVATELEKVSFHSNPKERQCQRILKLQHNYTHLSTNIIPVQLLSHGRLFATPWTITAHQSSLSITNSQSLPKLVHWVSDAIQPSHPLLLPSTLALNLSQHQSHFQWVSSSHQVAKVYVGRKLQCNKKWKKKAEQKISWKDDDDF